MIPRKNLVLTFAMIIALVIQNENLFAQNNQYTFPDETEQHEGTWLVWPHQYEYGVAYRNENDDTWVAMTNALQANENVHIIVYNTTQRTRVTNLLIAANVPLKIIHSFTSSVPATNPLK